MYWQQSVSTGITHTRYIPWARPSIVPVPFSTVISASALASLSGKSAGSSMASDRERRPAATGRAAATPAFPPVSPLAVPLAAPAVFPLLRSPAVPPPASPVFPLPLPPAVPLAASLIFPPALRPAVSPPASSALGGTGSPKISAAALAFSLQSSAFTVPSICSSSSPPKPSRLSYSPYSFTPATRYRYTWISVSFSSDQSAFSSPLPCTRVSVFTVREHSLPVSMSPLARAAIRGSAARRHTAAKRHTAKGTAHSLLLILHLIPIPSPVSARLFYLIGKSESPSSDGLGLMKCRRHFFIPWPAMPRATGPSFPVHFSCRLVIFFIASLYP